MDPCSTTMRCPSAGSLAGPICSSEPLQSLPHPVLNNPIGLLNGPALSLGQPLLAARALSLRYVAVELVVEHVSEGPCEELLVVLRV